jgi:hypothetical protein
MANWEWILFWILVATPFVLNLRRLIRVRDRENTCRYDNSGSNGSGASGTPSDPGSDNGGEPGDEHRGPIAANPTRADRVGDDGQQRGPDRRTNLTARVDHAANQSLVGIGHTAAGDHQRAERRARGAKAYEHHRQQ